MLVFPTVAVVVVVVAIAIVVVVAAAAVVVVVVVAVVVIAIVVVVVAWPSPASPSRSPSPSSTSSTASLSPSPYFVAEALAVWQWYNWLELQTPEGKHILRINLDGTSICIHQGGVAGNIFISKKRKAPVESVSASKRRRCMTHVALVCDRTDLQPLLPQFIIGNEATLLKKDLPALRALCPPSVRLICQISAWSNAKLRAKIIRELKKALQPHLGALQPVLLMDAARVHLKEALIACRNTGIWPILVPTKQTWLVQPLDTDGFFALQAHATYVVSAGACLVRRRGRLDV